MTGFIVIELNNDKDTFALEFKDSVCVGFPSRYPKCEGKTYTQILEYVKTRKAKAEIVRSEVLQSLIKRFQLEIE